MEEVRTEIGQHGGVAGRCHPASDKVQRAGSAPPIRRRASGVAFGYVMNQMRLGLGDDARTGPLIDADAA
jgi:hypothetical protein